MSCLVQAARVCLCVFWRQPLDHSETRTRRGQRLSHYPLFLSLLSPVPLFHVLFMFALSPPFPLFLYSLPLLIHISIRSLHQLALPRSTLQAISRRVTQDKSASLSSCIFRARTQARVNCGAGTGLMRSLSLSLT